MLQKKLRLYVFILVIYSVIVEFIPSLLAHFHLLTYSPQLMTIQFVLIGIPVVFFLFFVFRLLGPSKKQKQLLLTGQTAEAVILDIQDTGITVNGVNFNLRLTLNVQPKNEAPFQITTEAIFSRVQLPRLGDTLQVKYDPNDKSEVVICKDQNFISGGMTEEEANSELQKLMVIQSELQIKGISAQATILKYSPTNVRVNGDNKLFAVEFEVHPTDGNIPFQGKTLIAVRETSIYKLQIGKAINVKYDPDDKSKIVGLGFVDT